MITTELSFIVYSIAWCFFSKIVLSLYLVDLIANLNEEKTIKFKQFLIYYTM